WNEPDNSNKGSYDSGEPGDKEKLVAALLPRVFGWARSAHPSQPLTSGIWWGDWSTDEYLTPIQRTQLHESDVISFHSYDAPEQFAEKVGCLERLGRPIICTEYMARPTSTFPEILPVAKSKRVAAINWGLVEGKTQTTLPWDSWKKPYVGDRQPPV